VARLARPDLCLTNSLLKFHIETLDKINGELSLEDGVFVRSGLWTLILTLALPCQSWGARFAVCAPMDSFLSKHLEIIDSNPQTVEILYYPNSPNAFGLHGHTGLRVGDQVLDLNTFKAVTPDSVSNWQHVYAHATRRKGGMYRIKLDATEEQIAQLNSEIEHLNGMLNKGTCTSGVCKLLAKADIDAAQGVWKWSPRLNAINLRLKKDLGSQRIVSIEFVGKKDAHTVMGGWGELAGVASISGSSAAITGYALVKYVDSSGRISKAVIALENKEDSSGS
jgi:hypothetical protein